MSRLFQRILFLAILVVIALLGSEVSIVAEGRSNHQPNEPEGPTSFYYLPFVTNFPSVWFVKPSDSPSYLQNYANNAGCNWSGIAGVVWDLQGDPVDYGQYRVHIWGSGIDARPVVGDAPVYGPSAYEQQVFDSPVVRDYNLQLETADGSLISPVYSVQTHASCSENLLFFTFLQEY